MAADPKKTTRFKAQKQAAQNRRATFDYVIEEKLETGIVLTGTEVKTLRQGRASLADAFAGEMKGALYLFNAYIPEYGQAGAHLQHEPRRPRALLVHRRERDKLLGAVRRDGMTLVPLSIQFNKRGLAKVILALAKGKNKADKRASVRDREWSREKNRLMRDKG
ncbi:MAG: SsrA-binding protein SmpB [Alphaproteobacteria bacterium]|nr:MAG: SsrA-binding protein SmpB [Alphaproteobacteria bacterium]